MRQHLASMVLAIAAMSGAPRADEPTTHLPLEPAGTVYEKPFHRLGIKSSRTEDVVSNSALAVREGKQGIVSLAYSVDANGHPIHITLVLPLADSLNSAAADMLRHTTFDVPSSWVASGGPKLRYQYRVQYNLLRTGEHVAVDGGADALITVKGRP